MDIDFKLEVDHHWIYERPYKVTLTRGAGGKYRWEIEARGNDTDFIETTLGELDTHLREYYGGLEPPDQE